MSSCPRPCKIQTGRGRTIHRCLSLLQITYVKDSTYVPSVLNNHTHSQMLSNCNTLQLRFSTSATAKKKKPSTVMDIEEFVFTGQNSELHSQKGRLDVAEWLGITSQIETSADVGTEMTNTSWGQFQSGLSWQEILLLSKVISMKNRGALPLSPEVLVIS